jgi:5-methylcytosine-specific restriction endonuclease McrA
MRICSEPGCGRAVPDDVRWCAECKAEHTQDVKPSRWERSKTDPIMAEFSKPRWTRFRRLVMQDCPFCADCQCKASAVADHRIPARLIVRVCKALGLFPFDPWGGFYIRANMQGLCHSCHNKKTRVEDTMDWTDELVRVLAPYLRDKGIPDSEHRAKVLQAGGGPNV